MFEDVQLRRNVRYINRIESRRNLQFHRLINRFPLIPQPKKFLCSPKLPPSKHIYITNIHSAIFSLFDPKKKILDLYSARRTSATYRTSICPAKRRKTCTIARMLDEATRLACTHIRRTTMQQHQQHRVESTYIYMYIPDVNCVWSSLIYK